MKTFNPYNAENLTGSVWNLYSEMERKFGAEKAWEFVLNLYKGAAGE